MKPSEFVVGLAAVLGIPEREVRSADRALVDNELRGRAQGRWGPDISRVEAIYLLLGVRGSRVARRAHIEAGRWAQLRAFALHSRGGANVPPEVTEQTFGLSFTKLAGKRLLDVLSTICSRFDVGHLTYQSMPDLELDLTNGVATLVYGDKPPQAELFFCGSGTALLNTNKDVAHISGAALAWIAGNAH